MRRSFSRRSLRTVAGAVLALAVAGLLLFRFKFAAVPVETQTVQSGAVIAEVLGTGTLDAWVKTTSRPRLLGNFTRKDPLITEELRRFQRAGVPLVLVCPRAAAQPPIVLPVLLTPGIVLDALNAAAK